MLSMHTFDVLEYLYNIMILKMMSIQMAKMCKKYGKSKYFNGM